MKCPKCQFENPADTLYCGKCGTKLDFSEPVRGTGPTNNKISIAHTETLLKKIGLDSGSVKTIGKAGRGKQ